MASRASACLRTASRQLRVSSSTPSRTAVTAASFGSWTRARQAPLASSTPTPTPSSSSSSSATAKPGPAREPVPAVSGEPLPNAPPTTAPADPSDAPIDWSSSYHGLGTSAFGPDVAAVLQAPIPADDIEVKPDGILYLPEIKYRRILNTAFGPGGWGLAPRGDLVVQERLVSRDYALIVHGRFVGQARGEQQYFSEDGVSTAAEGCKSNALMRCCKDLGIASELWDPRFIRRFMKTHAMQIWAEHALTKKKKQVWLRKDDELRYPFKKAA
jgi:hypothetical protein